jgi:hypothetical protein
VVWHHTPVIKMRENKEKNCTGSENTPHVDEGKRINVVSAVGRTCYPACCLGAIARVCACVCVYVCVRMCKGARERGCVFVCVCVCLCVCAPV